jgi:hypothetical protein
MAKLTWQDIFRKKYPQAVLRRVPLGESPEEIIGDIDPSLKYSGTTFTGSNYLYLVRDSTDGLTKVLKVGSAPARVHIAQHEHDVFRRLEKEKILGVPQAYKFYNSGEGYDPMKFTAMLREHIDGENFDEHLRGKEVFERLDTLLERLNHAGVFLPRDFNPGNVLVDKSGQPYVIDFEESPLGSPGKSIEDSNMLREFFVYHVMVQMEKSKNPFLRLISKSPMLSRVVANLFYDGPTKPIDYGGW